MFHGRILVHILAFVRSYATIPPVSVLFRVESFEGPLDLLLQLVESQEMDISTMSLAAVTEQFLEYVKAEEGKRIPLEELADFLIVAAKLIYLKSRLLLPTLTDPMLDEGPDLETQLRRYQMFVEASKQIDVMWRSGLCSFPREHVAWKPPAGSFFPPPGITSIVMQQVMHRVIARLEPVRALPQAAVERVISIHDKIRGLLNRIKDLAQTTFHEFVGARATKAELVVSFLALLELVKQRFVAVEQNELFHDIGIQSHPDAPTHDPLANSFL